MSDSIPIEVLLPSYFQEADIVIPPKEYIFTSSGIRRPGEYSSLFTDPDKAIQAFRKSFDNFIKDINHDDKDDPVVFLWRSRPMLEKDNIKLKDRPDLFDSGILNGESSKFNSGNGTIRPSGFRELRQSMRDEPNKAFPFWNCYARFYISKMRVN